MFGNGWELAKACKGTLVGLGDIYFSGISIDSRTINDGEVFIAIIGERFDGHDFLKDAIKRGAKGVVVKRGTSIKKDKGFFIIYVDDTKVALGEIASYWRNKISPTVIAITGSCGKTSTKEMVHAILSKKYKTLKNKANLNNYFGVSLTLLSLKDEKFAVVEVGINQKYEMKEIAEIIKPDFSLITNIAPVHLEGLGSLQDIYMEKKILLDYAKTGVFLNNEDIRLKNYKRKGIRIRAFGRGGYISYKKPEILNEKSMKITLIEKKRTSQTVIFPYIGVNLASNISASALVGRFFGIEWENIKDALENVSLPSMRMEVKEVCGIRIILDAYNANPYSMKNAIDTFSLLNFKRKNLILGDMKELGRWSAYYHSSLGRYLINFPFHNIYLVGKEIEKTYKVLKDYGKKGVHYFKSIEECKKERDSIFKDCDAILLKGSRALALEKILERIC
jgi:UDP-N-acetylmuramoyl-tripeptide--D-alanyl-D-alanine ligase